MEPTLNTWTVLLLFAAAQGLFLGLVLMTHRRGNQRANRMLAILILLLSIRLLEIVGYWTRYLLEFPHFWLTTAAFPFLFGPLLFFYARFLTSENFKIGKRALLQLLPFALYLGWLMPYYRLSTEIKLRILERALAFQNYELPWLYFVIFMLQVSHMLFYTWLTLRLIKKHAQTVKGAVLSIEKISLRWLRNLTCGFGVFVTLTLLYVVCLQFGFPYSRALDALVLIAMAGQIYVIGYVTLRQPEIFSGHVPLRNAPKYEKSALAPAHAEAHLSNLIQAMEAEKLFVNNDLKLHDLARRLDMSPHHLSQIINEKLGQNFFDFLNHYRVEEAKRWLIDPERQHYTILSISQEVGFNSKASFNNAFKKHTGMTPSQFRDIQVKADKV
ncbi:MAG TPA: helix-turn-helix transcriptional regulator [bacterium]